MIGLGSDKKLEQQHCDIYKKVSYFEPILAF